MRCARHHPMGDWKSTVPSGLRTSVSLDLCDLRLLIALLVIGKVMPAA